MMLIKIFVALLLGLAIWQISGVDFRLSPKEVIVRKTPPMNVDYETTGAQTYLNKIRENMHMSLLSKNTNLAKAAEAHAKYMVINNESGHEEVKKHRAFVGEKPWDRAFKYGYLSKQVSENISTHHHSAKDSVDGLLSAIYHRFGFLDTMINEIGIGAYQDEYDSDKSAFVYLMGNSDLNNLCRGESFSKSGKYMLGCSDDSFRIREKDFLQAVRYAKQTNPDIVLYPFDGQRDVPPVFYSESPDPLPDLEVSGFPVSVEFNDFFYKNITLLSFSLYDNEGTPIQVKPMDKESDPNYRFTANQFAIFPLKRLEYNAKYHAEIVYKDTKEVKKKSWVFYTTRIQDEFYKVSKLYDELTIVPKKSYVIYFEPVDGHDLLTDLQFPEELDVQFIDHNTIKLTLMPELSDNLSEFVLDTGVKKLRLKIAH